MRSLLLRLASFSMLAMLALLVLSAAPLSAQGSARVTAKPAEPALLGTWTGMATVPLADSALVVPVTYTFTQVKDSIGGTAMTPGQPPTPITAVVRDGMKLTFRVVTAQGTLEHEATFLPDGALEGMISLNKQPVAKFKLKKQVTGGK